MIENDDLKKFEKICEDPMPSFLAYHVTPCRSMPFAGRNYKGCILALAKVIWNTDYFRWMPDAYYSGVGYGFDGTGSPHSGSPEEYKRGYAMGKKAAALCFSNKQAAPRC